MPHFEIKNSSAFYTQKANESPDDCQDAGLANPKYKRYAIADGVAGSFFPAEWAALLVEHFCNGTSSVNRTLFKSKNWREWLAPIQKDWIAQVNAKVTQKMTRAAFHLRNSLAEGVPAAAAFVGLKINDQNEAQPIWQAMILGDSCLFHLRGNHLTSYVVKESREFNYHPKYFASVPSKNKYEPEFVSGTFEKDDFFILATDALAKWILTRHETGGAIWKATCEELFYIRTLDEFHEFVKEARRDKEIPLEDDDVALITLSIVESTIKVKQAIPEPPLPRVPDPPLPVSKSFPEFTEKDIHYIVQSEHRRIQPPPNPVVKNKQKLSLPALALVIAGLSFFVSFLSLLNKKPVPHYPAKLASGVSIYLIPKAEQSATIFTVKKECQVSLIEAQINKDELWNKVQFDIWVSFSDMNQQNKFVAKDQVNNLSNPVESYAFSSLDSSVVGSFSKSVKPEQVIYKRKDNKLTWLQIRLVGFALIK